MIIWHTHNIYIFKVKQFIISSIGLDFNSQKKEEVGFLLDQYFGGLLGDGQKKRRKEKKEARFTYFFLLKKLSFYNIKTFFYNFWGLQTLYFIYFYLYIYIYIQMGPQAQALSQLVHEWHALDIGPRFEASPYSLCGVTDIDLVYFLRVSPLCGSLRCSKSPSKHCSLHCCLILQSYMFDCINHFKLCSIDDSCLEVYSSSV